MDIRYAIGLPVVGQFGDVRALLDLAVAAERHGWDGVHLWDHLLFDEPGWPVTSPVAAASAIAAATARVRIILTVAVPRRQVQEVAQDAAAIAALSGGRLTLVATLGSLDREYTEFGLDPDLRARGRALDERLDRLGALWREWGVPPVPIWCAARWPRKVGLRRAARFAGAMPIFDDQRVAPVPPADFAAAAAYVPGLDIALEGFTAGPAGAPALEPYAAAGMTWWIEALGWWRGDLAAAAARVAAGPPRPGL
ncbi:LLM class flavin-dependent oxidoreductase [Dactylosporangium sp. CA-092794]|uniref:LLM class flavin-dependent oxidoreductase n=1 Tax=Dactylosporangium sp. CA-092794 TaxID=3239929 RepID=UPI003D89B5A9